MVFMDKMRPWLSSYPEGVPTEINPSQYPSLKELLEHSFREFAELPAFSNLGTTLNFAQVEQFSRYFAAYLQSATGLESGDRVAIMMPNLLQYPVAIFGALRAGLIVVNVNPLYTPRELEHQLRDSGAKAIVIFENSAHVLQPVLDNVTIEHVIITKIGDYQGAIKGRFMNFVMKYIKRLRHFSSVSRTNI